MAGAADAGTRRALVQIARVGDRGVRGLAAPASIIASLLFVLATSLGTAIIEALAHADGLHVIRREMSFRALKQAFPRAAFARVEGPHSEQDDVSVSWHATYTLSGVGVPGRLEIDLIDRDRMEVDFLKQVLGEAHVQRLRSSEAPLASEDAFTVVRVTWFPSERVSVQRLVKDYGTPSRKTYREFDMSWRYAWKGRQLTASLETDEDTVTSITYGALTAEDQRLWYERTKHRSTTKTRR